MISFELERKHFVRLVVILFDVALTGISFTDYQKQFEGSGFIGRGSACGKIIILMENCIVKKL